MENLKFNKDTIRLYEAENATEGNNIFFVSHKDAENLYQYENDSNLKNVTEKYSKEIDEFFDERERYIADRQVKYAGYPQFMWKHLDKCWPLPSLKQWVKDTLNGKKDSTTFIYIPNSDSFMQIDFSGKHLFPVSLNEVNDSGGYPEVYYKNIYDDNSRKSVSQMLITLLALSDAEIELTDEQIEKVINLIEKEPALS